MQRQPYAPLPPSYVPTGPPAATISLDDEVRLADSRAERGLHESLAELFSIVVTIDELEKAFLKDAVPEGEYADICERSLKQYASILKDEAVAAAFGSLEQFKTSWDLDVPRAMERIKAGMPSTALTASSTAKEAGAGAGGSSGVGGALILEATQDFITFLDALRLGLLAKDQLHPLLTDVIHAVNRVTDRDFPGRGKIVQWLIALNQLKATDVLDDAQARELELDMNSAYQGFKGVL